MNKTIALISPHFPPQHGGVSDYTHKLQLAFLKKGIKTIVITGERSLQTPSVFPLPIPFESNQVLSILEKEKVSDVIIQYTPRPYNPKYQGAGISLIRLLWSLQKKYRVHIYAHESHYPVNLSRLGLTLGVFHFVQFYIMAMLCENILFSTTYFKNQWQPRLFFKKNQLRVVPIGSNIIRKDNQSSPLPKNQIVFFASNHPTCLKEIARKTIMTIATDLPHFNFVILGVLEKDFPLNIDPQRKSYPGRISEENISHIYQESLASLSVYHDGCSSRRGTLLASMAHHIPVFTNLGFSSAGDIPWKKLCFIPESGKASDLPSFMRHTLSQNNLIKSKKEYLSMNYDKFFSWNTIANQILTSIK